MIEHHLDTENAILHIQPRSALEKADFETLAATADPFIAETGGLAGGSETERRGGAVGKSR